MSNAPDKLDVDMRSPEENEDVKKFIEELNELREKHKVDLVMSLDYNPGGIKPALTAVKRQNG